MNEDQMTLLGIQQIVIDECIRAIIYSRKYASLDRTNHNKFVNSALNKMIIIQWCQIFGSRNEEIHWTKVDLGPEYSPFDRSRIHELGGFFSQGEWEEYHSNMKRLRDKFFAHFDMNILHDAIPSFDKALTMLLAYRQWIIDAIDTAQINGVLINRGFKTNQEFLEDVEGEL